MAIDTETMQVIERCVARAVANATSLKGAADEIAKGVTQYVGARYVPLFAEPLEWDKTKAYEPLTIVLYQGNSYTSRQYVPVGIELTNESFWAKTGNYNAQIEQYRQDVKTLEGRITANANAIETETTNRTAAVSAEMERAQSAERVLQANIDVEKTRATDKENEIIESVKKCDKSYKNVNELKSDTELVSGMLVHTSGFYSSSDGGDAFYTISSSESQNANDMDIIECSNGLVAHLIYNSVLDVDKIGAIDKDNAQPYFEHALTLVNTVVGKKSYKVSEPVNITSNKTIIVHALTSNNSNPALSVNGKHVTVIANSISSAGSAIELGRNNSVYNCVLKINYIIGNKCIYIAGSNQVYDVNIYGVGYYYNDTGIDIDIESGFAGQINFYGMRVSINGAEAGNQALHINCNGGPCTGLNFTNVSFEGNANGIVCDNMNGVNRLENIYGNIRCSEIFYKYKKKVLILNGKTDSETFTTRGTLNVGAISMKAIETNINPANLSSAYLVITGVIEISSYATTAIYMNGYDFTYDVANATQELIGVPNKNEITSNYLLIDSYKYPFIQYRNAVPKTPIYVFSKQDGVSLRLYTDSTNFTEVQLSNNDLLIVFISRKTKTSNDIKYYKLTHA